MEITQLVEIKDVTKRVQDATRNLAEAKFQQALKSEFGRIEKECATSDKFRCDVVTLYHGGAYHLYKYRRFMDVRLVFAPEMSIAFFGGDPDNFNFPRFDLDASFVRVYEDGKPAVTEHHLEFAAKTPKEGELTFTSGHPGGTSRLLTMAQLEEQRDHKLPDRLMRLAQWRGFLYEYGKKGAEAKRVSTDDLFSIENSFKALEGERQALLEKRFWAAKEAAEKELRAKVDADPALKKKFGGAWDGIARAIEEYYQIDEEYLLLEKMQGFDSDLFHHARKIVRAGDELPKKNDDRLLEYQESKLPFLKHSAFSPAPIDADYEIAKLAFTLIRLRERLGTDHPFVKKILGKDSPDEVAARLVRGSKLADVAERKRLWDGGKKAIAASKDTMIQLAVAIDGEARKVRKRFEEKVEGPTKKYEEQIAQARFAVYGMNTYPDATFTLRLSYGQVKGWTENGKTVKPFTSLGGTFERATGKEPFALPASWLGAKGRLDAGMPFNMVTTNDIIGGNSGSPLINKNAEIVGLVFDGNIHSLGGEFGFDVAKNRTVVVTGESILHVLTKIYGADRIVEEIKQPPVKPKTASR
jgi:hypothetical protein